MRALILLLIGIWAGLAFGISFLEAPLKFQAPGITTELGLSIGRIVFDYSNKIQLLLLLIILIALYTEINKISIISKLTVTILLIIAGIQSLHLLPILDDRALLIINNHDVPNSNHHICFVGLEIIKIMSLIYLFFNLNKTWKT